MAIAVLSDPLRAIAYTQQIDKFEEFFVKEVQPFLRTSLDLKTFRKYSSLFSEVTNPDSEVNVVRVSDSKLPVGGREFFIALLLYTRILFKDNSKKIKLVCPNFDDAYYVMNDILNIFEKNQDLANWILNDENGYGINFSSSGQAVLKSDLHYYSHIFILNFSKFDERFDVPLSETCKIISLEDFSN
jgi:hypothetical protein